MHGKDEICIQYFDRKTWNYLVSKLWFVKCIQIIRSRRPFLLLLPVSREPLLLAKENGVRFFMFPPHTNLVTGFQLLQISDVL
jgi:hypothetical protein